MFWINLAIDLLEELAGTFNFRMLDGAQFHAGHGAFGLCHEINVLDRAFLEGNGPVRVVITDRSGNQKSAGQFCVNHHLGAGIQLLHELPFHFGVGDHIVVNMIPELLAGFGEILATLPGGEDVYIVRLGDSVIGCLLYTSDAADE